MKALSKVCDASDWFDPEFDRIVRRELAEEPRLHRKQWEFAQIFRTLEQRGLLTGTSTGLSMGGGDERVMYAVARRARHLTVTDLYEAGSAWEGACTDHPDRFLKDAAPFPIDPTRLTARRMDMRDLDFDDESFDFCYSACAIEHIGADEDFLRHLREVRRVLKDDGIYVLTTEFHYGDTVIPAPHNYYFSAAFLHELIRAASLAVVGDVDGTVRPHPLNRPLPANLRHLFAAPDDPLMGLLVTRVPHVQLLTDGLPFSSISLALTKRRSRIARGVLPVAGLEESRRFLAEGVRQWQDFVERAEMSLDPYALVAGSRPARAAPRLVARDGDGTLFHTGYVWLGSAPRTVTIEADVWPAEGCDARVELRVHQHLAQRPDDVICSDAVTLAVVTRERVRVCLRVAPEVGRACAVLGKVTAGACWIGELTVGLGPERRAESAHSQAFALTTSLDPR